MEVAKSKAVTYDCMLLSKDSVEKVKEILEQSDILGTLKTLGISIPDITMQENMHCTLRYMAGKNNEHKRDYQLCNDELHRPTSIVITEIGAYAKDDILRNIGFRVDETQCTCEGEPIPSEFFTNDISHITVAINQDVDAEGKRLAKAVDTPMCFFNKVYEDNEMCYTILLAEPIELDATLEAIVGREIVETLSDYPELREERERKEEEQQYQAENDEYEMEI